MDNILKQEIEKLVEEKINEKLSTFGHNIANFELVSEEQFISDAIDKDFDEALAREAYQNLKLPKASTSGSAGFDFYTPFNICLSPGQSLFIPTGIRCKMDSRWALLMMPRSGHGTKFRIQLDNTIGLIDEDYYYANNEGHIMIKITNDSKENKNFFLEANNKFVQGIFVYTGIAKDAILDVKRTNGFGSTK